MKFEIRWDNASGEEKSTLHQEKLWLMKSMKEYTLSHFTSMIRLLQKK